MNHKSSLSRRTLLGGLAASPLILRAAPSPMSADQVINVMDFEPLARAALPPAHFVYIATGADDDRTLVRNHEAFSDYQIRARRFNDTLRLTTATSVLGAAWASPLSLQRFRHARLSSRRRTRGGAHHRGR